MMKKHFSMIGVFCLIIFIQFDLSTGIRNLIGQSFKWKCNIEWQGKKKSDPEFKYRKMAISPTKSEDRITINSKRKNINNFDDTNNEEIDEYVNEFKIDVNLSSSGKN